MERNKKTARRLRDVPTAALAGVVEGMVQWAPARKRMFLEMYNEVRTFASADSEVIYPAINPRGGVKQGNPLLFGKTLREVFDKGGTTGTIGSLDLNVCLPGEVRTLVVGQVCILKNDDARYKENWYVMIVELYPPSESAPMLVGKGVWLWGEEEVRKYPGCSAYRMEGGPRAVLLSTYPFEIRLNTIVGVCRAYPTFLDLNVEEDVTIVGFFNHVEKTQHPLLCPPRLDEVLAVYKDIATRHVPVSTPTMFDDR